MAFQKGKDILTCANCSARHEVRWERLPVREEYSLRCRACPHMLAEGKGVKDYVDVRLVDGR